MNILRKACGKKKYTQINKWKRGKVHMNDHFAKSFNCWRESTEDIFALSLITKEIFRKSLEIHVMISDHFWLKGTPQKYWHPSVCEDKNLTPSFDMAGYMYAHDKLTMLVWSVL